MPDTGAGHTNLLAIFRHYRALWWLAPQQG